METVKVKGQHGTRMENSDRLRRVYLFLRDRGTQGATSLEIALACKTPAVSTAISELRHKNGLKIHRTREGKTANGSAIHRYRLAPIQEVTT